MDTSQPTILTRGEYRYVESGAGEPLVLLHGLFGALSNFEAVRVHFSQRFRVIIPMLPIYDLPLLSTGAKALAAHIAGFIDEMGLQKVHLLGNSLGGGTAMRLALSYPDRVGRLVLMGPGGLSLNLFHADPTEGVQRLMDFGADPTRDKLRAFISTMVVDQSLVTDELVEERFADATAPGAQEAMRSMGMSFWNPETAEDGMLWREAHRLRKHTLLTWGREDRVNPLDGAMIALKLIPKASLHVFPNCGHWAQIEAADEFRDVATSFYARHVERDKR